MRSSSLVYLGLLIAIVSAGPHPAPHPQYRGSRGGWRPRPRPNPTPTFRPIVPSSPSPSSTTAIIGQGSDGQQGQGALPEDSQGSLPGDSQGTAQEEDTGNTGNTNPRSSRTATRLAGNTGTTTPKETGSSSSGTSPGVTTGGDGGGGLPANCAKINGIGIGWVSPEDPTRLGDAVSPTAGPCTYGVFAFIQDGTSMPDNEISAGASAALAAGAIYVVSLKPGVAFSAVSAAAVAASMNAVADQAGGQVWLRFAHEFNWYSRTGEYTGSAADFVTTWTAIAAAVDRSKVKMYWCPNPPGSTGDSTASLKRKWYPGDDAVDIVGIDVYGQDGGSFGGSVPADFCGSFPQEFHVGEAGWLGGGTAEQKKAWWGVLTGTEAKRVCGSYVGFQWFEYNKPGAGDANGDYTIVSGKDGNLLAKREREGRGDLGVGERLLRG